jgi:hypothetical protein
MKKSPTTDILDGLSEKSSEKAQKSFERIRSWEDAVAHTKERIRELRKSLRLFEEKVRTKAPWPGTQKKGLCADGKRGLL